MDTEDGLVISVFTVTHLHVVAQVHENITVNKFSFFEHPANTNT